MTIDMILETIKDEKDKEMVKLSYELGVQDTLNLLPKAEGTAPEYENERFDL